MNNKGFTVLELVIGLVCLGSIAASVAFTSYLVYVAVHFIEKLW